MSKLAIQGLLAITATLWLAQPIDTPVPLNGVTPQINVGQINDNETLSGEAALPTVDRGDDESRRS